MRNWGLSYNLGIDECFRSNRRLPHGLKTYSCYHFRRRQRVRISEMREFGMLLGEVLLWNDKSHKLVKKSQTENLRSRELPHPQNYTDRQERTWNKYGCRKYEQACIYIHTYFWVSKEGLWDCIGSIHFEWLIWEMDWMRDFSKAKKSRRKKSLTARLERNSSDIKKKT